MLESLAVIVSTSLPLAYGMVMCASERDAARKNKKKSERSKKGGKSGKSGRSRSKKSTRSGRSKSRKSKSRKSRKSSKSGKSGKSKRKSSKSSRSKKSSRSTRTAKQKSAKLAKDAERKLEKSAKSSSSCNNSNNSSCKKPAAPVEEKTATTPNAACNNNNSSNRECGAKKSNIAEELRSIKHLKTMSVVPSRLPFASQGGINSIDIKNNSNERKAYKVKCSDNLLYRVNPVFGFAEPNSTTRVDVLRANGEEKMDKLVVITATVNNEKDARSVFGRDGLEHEMMVVPLTVN